MRSRDLIAGGVVAAAQALLAGVVARFGLTTPLPLHIDASGEVSHWGGRSEAAGVILMMAALAFAASFGLRLAADRRLDGGKGLAITEAVTLLVTMCVSGLMAAIAFGYWGAERHSSWIHMAVLWLILGLTGSVLGKVAPNSLVGVRTPWTFASRLSWDKTNRLAGRLFLGASLIGVLCAPFAPEPAGLRVSLMIVLIIAGLLILESWRVWRRDPNRRVAQE